MPGRSRAAAAVLAIRLGRQQEWGHVGSADQPSVSLAVFAGAFVSGLAGFAFSAVAGAILLRIFQPLEAVPLMMACSVGVQAANLWALRRSIEWRGSGLLIAGGALGIPIAVFLLRNADTHILRVGFGAFVSLYAAYMLFRPTFTRFGGRPASADGADRIWRRPDRRLDGDARCHSDHLVRYARHAEERPARPGPAVHRHHAIVWAGAAARAPQPVRQGCGRSRDQHTGAVCRIVLGIVAFRNINEVGFRKTILVVLLFSGVSLAFA